MLGVYLVGHKLTGERTALLASVIYGFSITNLFMLEQGFFPQLMGQFFFIASVYSLMSQTKSLLLLSNIGLISYPHYFGIFLLFLALQSIRRKELFNLVIPLLATAILAPEVYNLISGRISVSQQYNVPLRGYLLLKGGVLTPTFFSLAFLSLSLPGYRSIFKKRDTFQVDLNLSILALTSTVAIAFAYVFLAGYTRDIRHLYVLAKTFYLLVFPLSIATAITLERIMEGRKILVAALLSMYILYFAGYAFFVLPAKANFPGEAYEIFERMDTLEGEFIVGVDPSLIKNTDWTPQHPYKSIVDVPDVGYSSGAIAKVELNRALQFHWANYRFTDEGPVVVDSRGEPVVRYISEDVDYYVTEKAIEGMIIFQEGDVKVYKLKNESGM
jgi:hypothetical protein